MCYFVGVQVPGLGFAKSLSLFYRAHHLLSTYSQFADLSLALQLTCAAYAGAAIYEPDVWRPASSPTPPPATNQTFTAQDCETIDLGAVQYSKRGGCISMLILVTVNVYMLLMVVFVLFGFSYHRQRYLCRCAAVWQSLAMQRQ